MAGASEAKRAGAELVRCHKLFVNEVRCERQQIKSSNGCFFIDEIKQEHDLYEEM